MKEILNLNGDWQITGFSPDGKQKKELNGTVPGHIHHDLLEKGLIKDPFWRDQADACQWVEDWNWYYQKEFDIPQDFDLKHVVLEFAGLDTFAEIILNGTVIANTDNMFVNYRFNVDKILKHGKNQLQVKFTPVKKAIEDKSYDHFRTAFGNPERVYVRRMQCTFYWDWVHRFVSAGIWKPVTIYSYEPAHIENLYLYTEAIEDNKATLHGEFTVARKSNENIKALTEIIDPEGQAVWSEKMDVKKDVTDFVAEISEPQLWWPNGYGEHPLYQYKVTLYNLDNKKIDEKETTFGIRTIKIEQIEDEVDSAFYEKTLSIRQKTDYDNGQDEPGKSFTLIINGEKIFCKGGNWVPADPFPSRIEKEHYQRLIELLRRGNMNMLRCWGGGIYEPDIFWEFCNRNGIMVSQDFLMACGEYPETDSDFLDNLQQEFKQAIIRLRNHPSLVWWSGDNELGMNDDFDEPDYNGREFAEKVSGPLCDRLDPSRPFLLTSPYGGRPNNSLTVGDSHPNHCWCSFFPESESRDHRPIINNYIGRFMSEYAVAGSPSIHCLSKIMSEEDIIGPDCEMWEYRTKDNPHMDLTLYQILETNTEKIFGENTDPYQKVKHMEYVQYEWIRQVVEAARRNKFYCSGIQFWMYNDCWPAVGWSMVDYYGFPKAGWYAMKGASQPVISSIEKADGYYKIWICNDLLMPINSQLNLRVQPWQGKAIWKKNLTFSQEANKAQVVLEIKESDLEQVLNLGNILVCDIKGDFGSDSSYYYDGLPYQMSLPPAELEITKESISEDSNSKEGKITITTDNYARVVTLSGDVDFSDNYFDLLPGDKKTIAWRQPDGVYGDTGDISDINISCWNQK